MPDGEDPAVLLDVHEVSHRYRGRAVLDKVSLQIRGPGLIGLLGPNGAGKTTLIRCLAGILRPTSGTVSSGPGARHRIGYLPQRLGFNTGFTAQEHVEYVAWLGGIPRAERSSRAADALATLDLASEGATAMSKLSGGTRQRVGLAAALVTSPQLLLLDEPTQGLDIAQARTFREHISDVSQTVAVILSSHNIQDYAHDREASIVILKAGRKVFDDRLSALGASTREGLRGIEDAYLEIVR